LLDAELLSEVYLCMTRGQEMLLMDIGFSSADSADEPFVIGDYELIVISATEEELGMHARHIEEIHAASRGACVWKQFYPLLQAEAA
jgi:DNA polymerase III subunit epsilon